MKRNQHIEDCIFLTRDICTMLSLQKTSSLQSILPRHFYTVGNTTEFGIVFTKEDEIYSRDAYSSHYHGLVEQTSVLKDGMKLPPDLERAVSKGQIMIRHVPKLYREDKILVKVTKNQCNFSMNSYVDLKYTESEFVIGSSILFDVIQNETIVANGGSET